MPVPAGGLVSQLDQRPPDHAVAVAAAAAVAAVVVAVAVAVGSTVAVGGLPRLRRPPLEPVGGDVVVAVVQHCPIRPAVRRVG